MKRQAWSFTSCIDAAGGEFRYAAVRKLERRSGSIVVFAALHPKGDEARDWHWLRTAERLARHWRFGEVCVVYLFARRSLGREAALVDEHGDAVEATFRTALRIVRARGGKFVPAWGRRGAACDRDARALDWATQAGVTPYVFGTASTGHPAPLVNVARGVELHEYVRAAAPRPAREIMEARDAAE